MTVLDMTGTGMTSGAVQSPNESWADEPGLGVRISAGEPRWFRFVYERLNEIDCVASRRLVRNAMMSAVRLFDNDTPTPSVILTPETTIQFVWHKSGWDIEIEVGESAVAIWGEHREDGRLFEGPEHMVRDQLKEMLGHLAGRD